MSECARPGVPHGQTESGAVVLAVMLEYVLESVRSEAVLPDRALNLPTLVTS